MPGFRELHLGGDDLLVYRVDDNQHLVVLTDRGTHGGLPEQHFLESRPHNPAAKRHQYCARTAFNPPHGVTQALLYNGQANQ
ncbi:type II toxin-antitoxin system RelE/ParE family toxin [Kosakonia sp.]|uniref:hypothetical protein n=1 Tax=Kosakonia sp. TaxID=1916651 RepID=UPI00390C702C